MLCARLPLTPVMVSVLLPVGVLALVVTESVDDEVAGLGLKEPVALLGRPSTLRLTEPAKPPLGAIVTA